MAADGGKAHVRDPDPERFLPRAAEQARRVTEEMDRYRRDLDRPSRLVGDDVRAEGRAVVDGLRDALRQLLDALESGAAPKAPTDLRTIEGRPKDE